MNTRTLWVLVGVAALGVLAGCGDGHVSDGCPDGTWGTRGDAGSACIAWTTCAPGQYETAPGTTASDRTCAPCAPGTSEPACSTTQDCVPGEYHNTSGATGPVCESCATGTFSTQTNTSSCTAWRTCEAGQYVVEDGAAVGDRVCGACPSGHFSTASNVASCTPWTTCEAGERVAGPGSARADRTCLVCPTGTFTSGQNQTSCVSAGDCLPGTEQTGPATSTSAAVCVACTAGQHCAGAAAPAVVCDGGTWDHDRDPATACAPRTNCLAGTFVSSAGDATHDRMCSGCSLGRYSSSANAAACTTWTDCGGGTYMVAAGTATSDRTCAGCPVGTFNPAPVINVSSCTAWRECAFDQAEGTPGSALANRTCVSAGWTVQFGTSASDEALSVSAGDFSIAVGGRTSGAFPLVTANGGTDAFVSVYNTAGVHQWTRQFGAGAFDSVTAVAMNVGEAVVATGPLDYQPPGGFSYSLRQYRPNSVLHWAHQLSWAAVAVSTGSEGTVFVAGRTTVILPGQSSLDLDDAALQKYSEAGSLLWTRQFGTAATDEATAVHVGGDGSVVVAGMTFGALPGHTHLGQNDAFIRKYDADGTLLWTRQFGTSNYDFVTSVSVGSDGAVVVGGTTLGALPGQTNLGSADAFVRKYDGNGALLWTRQFGGDSWETATGVSTAPDGRVLVVGGAGPLLPQGDSDTSDAFLMTYDAAGTLLRTRRFGSSGADWALAVTLANSGRALVAGSVEHALPGRVSVGSYDAFLRAIDNP